MRCILHSLDLFRVSAPAGTAGAAGTAVPPKRCAFTVLELVMVIGVLSVLLAIVMPTIKTVRAAALRKQAKVGATALAQAAIRYKTEYGFWPGQLEADNMEDTVKLRDEFEISALQPWVPAVISRYENLSFTVTTKGTAPVYIDENWVYQAFRRVGDKSSDTFQTNPLNPKGLHFLDLQNETDLDRVSYPDPWGHEYILIMGLNPASTFTHEIKNAEDAVIATLSVSNQIAFAFSRGSIGPQATNYIYSAGVTP